MKASNLGAPEAPDAPATFGLGERFKLLRTIHGMSLAELAERTGMTKSYLSKVERGLSEPSFASVLKVCQAYGITTGQLLGEEPSEERLQLTRKKERTPLRRLKKYEGYIYEALANKRASKAMQPFVMHPPPKSAAQATDLVSHQGEELLFVIKGEIEFMTHEKNVRLASGDALYFDATIPHRSLSIGKTPAEVLVVTTDVSASR
jgi:transcriptional regulator with XRE-family HTH domain